MRDLTELQNEEFDVVIIGGGITGAWLALHCVQNQLRTALIERGDYAGATSSASSKLLHGGIRYLQQFQFDKVRESAMERAQYIYAAPHLSTPVPFIIPTYRDFQRSKFFLHCGMLAYRALCLGENRLIDNKLEQLPGSYSLSDEQLNQLCNIEHESHTGGVVFYERHMLDSERMVLAIIQSARKLGAVTFNHVNAEKFLGDENRVTGIRATDSISGAEFDIRSKLVINAAGPFINNLNTKLKNAKQAPAINGFAVGSHIITRQLSDHAIALTTKHQSNAVVDRGGRHVFVIPWRGYSLVGTSYHDIDGPNEDLSLRSEQIDQLVEAVNEGMPSAKLCRDDVISGYSGLYPLNTDNIQRTVYQGSGEYQIIDHTAANDVDGIITALGAKFTTGRKISELTLKLVAKKMGIRQTITPSKLVGSNYASADEFTRNKCNQYQHLFSAETVKHLVMLYGSELDRFIARIEGSPELLEPITASQPDILGQVVWAVEQEHALTLDDFIYGRSSLAMLGIKPTELNVISEQMASSLVWNSEQKRSFLHQSQARLEKTQQAIQGGYE